MVLKPAEQTPLTALRLGELSLAGMPEGDQHGHRLGPDRGPAIAAHPGLDQVAFPCSTESDG